MNVFLNFTIKGSFLPFDLMHLNFTHSLRLEVTGNQSPEPVDERLMVLR